jgi:hypothetical protein
LRGGEEHTVKPINVSLKKSKETKREVHDNQQLRRYFKRAEQGSGAKELGTVHEKRIGTRGSEKEVIAPNRAAFSFLKEGPTARWLAILALALCGCAAVGPPDFGPQPSNPGEAINRWFLANLKDPSSLQVAGTSGPSPFAGHAGGWKEGWVYCVTFNAKDSYGGYTGFETWGFLLRNEQVVVVDNGPGWLPCKS